MTDRNYDTPDPKDARIRELEGMLAEYRGAAQAVVNLFTTGTKLPNVATELALPRVLEQIAGIAYAKNQALTHTLRVRELNPINWRESYANLARQYHTVVAQCDATVAEREDLRELANRLTESCEECATTFVPMRDLRDENKRLRSALIHVCALRAEYRDIEREVWAFREVANRTDQPFTDDTVQAKFAEFPKTLASLEKTLGEVRKEAVQLQRDGKEFGGLDPEHLLGLFSLLGVPSE